MQISVIDNMRGNSGFLRLAVIGCLLVCSVTGGPPRPRRMMRETFSSPIEESVPMSVNTTSDSGTCSYNGKEVLKSSVMCEKKDGCREIETHGECCPKLLCECKLNGTIYDNGDKIVDPENPCEVCVCRGGEINCNALKCYTRNDCKNVTYTPGVCCPEYSNCPPLENVELNSSNDTTTTENSNDYSSSTMSLEASGPASTTTAQTKTQSSDSPGIKIKEITKPEEIRITDDRPKIFETIKSNEAIATKTSSALHSQEIEPEHESPLAVIPDEASEIQPEIEPEIEQHTSFDGSADEPIQLESTDLNTVGHVSMGPKIVRQTGTDMKPEQHTTISPFSSENEIKDEPSSTMSSEHITEDPMESTSVKHNTSVLQVGDSVVIFDRSGQTQSIPLRVAGLQRGEDTYDEEEERKEGRKTDETIDRSTPESADTSTDQMLEQSPTTEIFEVYYYEPNDMSTMSLDFPIDGASGDDGDELKYGSGESPTIGGSTGGSIEITSGYSSIEKFTDPMLAQQSTVDERTVSYDSESSSTTSDEISTDFDNFGSSTGSSPSYSSEPTTTTAIDADDDLQQDQNINFPHITDDLSIHGSRMEDRMEDEDKTRVNGKVVESELEKIKTNEEGKNRQDDSSSTVGPFENISDSTNFKDVEGRSPGEPLLIPEWERNHTTVAPFELVSSSSSGAKEDHSSAEMSSHENDPINTSVVGDESTTNEPPLSRSTDSIDTNPSTSESDYEVESSETHSTSGPSEFRDTNNFNLFLDGTANFFRIQKNIWNSAVL